MIKKAVCCKLDLDYYMIKQVAYLSSVKVYFVIKNVCIMLSAVDLLRD